MVPNFLVLAATSLIPFFIAFIWYHPRAFGGETWTIVAGLSPKQAANPVKIFGLILSVLLNFFVAVGLYNLTVHASGVFGMVGADVELMKSGTAAAFLAEYGTRHASFGHGVVHGILSTLLFVVPIMGYVTIFERKNRKYFFVTVGFWLISLILMGGIISQWGGTLVVE